VRFIRSEGDMKAILSPGTKCFGRIGDGILSDILCVELHNSK
jgi:hypothetical protein